jgi:hypothetical protein
MQPRSATGLVLAAAIALARPVLGADVQAGAPDAKPAPAVDALNPVGGLVMLDYQSIPVRGYPSIDLLGTHALTQISEGLYVGVGAHAPLVKGHYGGFMAFDVTLHAQHDVVGRLHADGGVSIGGGAGGGSAQQARIIAGVSLRRLQRGRQRLAGALHAVCHQRHPARFLRAGAVHVHARFVCQFGPPLRA